MSRVMRGIGCLCVAMAMLGSWSLAGLANGQQETAQTPSSQPASPQPASPPVPDAPAPPALSLSTILERGARFVSRYADRASGMVVEEAYVQDVVSVNRFGYRTNNLRSGATHRTLKSDLLFVRPIGAESWMQFRDVFEVDGRKLRDRNDRLTKLFVEPSKSTAAQVDKIMRESARYNIGDVERTINLPMLGLSVLDRRAQGGFEFRFDDTKTLPGDVMAVPKTPAFEIPAEAIAVAFKEIQIQTMVRNPQGKNLAAKGRFWFVPSSGDVIMTELRIEDYSLSAAIHVTYRPPPGIEVPMPAAMHEMYENRLNSRRVEGTATYSNFREFNVAVDEQIAPAAPPQ